jgi:hypothetical protein
MVVIRREIIDDDCATECLGRIEQRRLIHPPLLPLHLSSESPQRYNRKLWMTTRE